MKALRVAMRVQRFTRVYKGIAKVPSTLQEPNRLTVGTGPYGNACRELAGPDVIFEFDGVARAPTQLLARPRHTATLCLSVRPLLVFTWRLC